MRPVIVYTLARILLLAVVGGVLFLVGARGFVLVLLALLISGLASYVLLSRQRDLMSEVFARRSRRNDDDEPK